MMNYGGKMGQALRGPLTGIGAPPSAQGGPMQPPSTPYGQPTQNWSPMQQQLSSQFQANMAPQSASPQPNPQIQAAPPNGLPGDQSPISQSVNNSPMAPSNPLPANPPQALPQTPPNQPQAPQFGPQNGQMPRMDITGQASATPIFGAQAPFSPQGSAIGGPSVPQVPALFRNPNLTGQPGMALPNPQIGNRPSGMPGKAGASNPAAPTPNAGPTRRWG
jgi:hypothetical protein